MKKIAQTVTMLPSLERAIAVLQPYALIGIVSNTVMIAKKRRPTSAKATPGLASEARRSRPVPVVCKPSKLMPIPTAMTPAMWGGVRRSFRKITARNAASAP